MSTTRTPATVQPYLMFNGRCEEALNFYRQGLGAEVDVMMRFKDSPEPPSADCVRFHPKP
jgi:PhnB protein